MINALQTLVLVGCLFAGGCATDASDSFVPGSPNPWDNGHPHTHQLGAGAAKSGKSSQDCDPAERSGCDDAHGHS